MRRRKRVLRSHARRGWSMFTPSLGRLLRKCVVYEVEKEMCDSGKEGRRLRVVVM